MIAAVQGVIRNGTSPVTAVQATAPLSLPEGEYFEITVNVVGENGAAIDMTGYTGVLTVKKKASDPSSRALFARASTSTTAGGAVKFVGTEIDTLGKKGAYLWDCYVTDIATGRSYQVVLDSRFNVADAVTDLDGPVTPAAGGVLLIGVPSPLVAKALLAVNAAGTALEWSVYTPANPAAWSGSPTTLAEAVDRLAAVLSSLIEGPIP